MSIRSLESVWWNACIHRLEVGLHVLPKELKVVAAPVAMHEPNYSHLPLANEKSIALCQYIGLPPKPNQLRYGALCNGI